ncbi:hypothetical protein M422DRAFT_248165 [Sphaerobolus stellatus SS14]|uniref:Uncharacterized protein n=1 Tax=Sphaerobolus stellatus (strain SS14) TaxID=990650 RepID=A0A0C9VJ59_SPHS4|nr:hypothetical protein M422DRAFT_248165 [Sphaerobolus stellatus SS14]
MSVPNTIRDDPDSYFLKEDVDVVAWLIADIPHPAFMHQMKVIFGSRLNFETILTRWITDSSTPIRIGPHITKGPIDKTQTTITDLQSYYALYGKDEEKRPMSAAGVERAAYMLLHQSAPAPNKGKKPLTGTSQSKPSAHTLQPAKLRQSSHQRLDADLEAYHKQCEPVLPYSDEPPSGEPDVEMHAPTAVGAHSTLPDESTMNIDHELDDLYE